VIVAYSDVGEAVEAIDPKIAIALRIPGRSDRYGGAETFVTVMAAPRPS
jgi:hypothetical protein